MKHVFQRDWIYLLSVGVVHVAEWDGVRWGFTEIEAGALRRFRRGRTGHILLWVVSLIKHQTTTVWATTQYTAVRDHRPTKLGHHITARNKTGQQSIKLNGWDGSKFSNFIPLPLVVQGYIVKPNEYWIGMRCSWANMIGKTMNDKLITKKY